MRFGYLNASEIMTKLKGITEQEGVHITELALERLIEINNRFSSNSQYFTMSACDPTQ